MNGHPRYVGPVVDSHVHVDGPRMPAFESAMMASGVSLAVNLWNSQLPPPSFPAWRDEVWSAAQVPDRQVPYHFPQLEGVGTEGFEERLAREITAAAEEGAGGLKIWKHLGLRLRDADDQVVAVDDRRLDALWHTAGVVGLPISIHIGDPVAFFEPLEPENERYQELQEHPDWWFGGPEHPWHVTELVEQLAGVVERHPDTCFVGVHMGCLAEDLDIVARMLERLPNYHIDTAARIAEIGRQDPSYVRAFFERFHDRILFGSDLARTAGLMLPDVDAFGADLTDFYALHWQYLETPETGLDHPYASQGAWTVDGIDLPTDVLNALYWHNAQRLIAVPWRERLRLLRLNGH